jgi:hypothetical protein
MALTLIVMIMMTVYLKRKDKSLVAMGWASNWSGSRKSLTHQINVRGYGVGKQLALLKKALNPPPNQSGHVADKQILEEQLKKLPNQQGHGIGC